MQSAPNATGLPSNSSSFFAAGRTEYFGSGPPFGRPRCEASTSRPPFSIASFNVGSVSRMRVSSVTTPSLSGTLKSTRINTRFPRKSKSLIVSLFMSLEFARHQLDQIPATARIAPFVVVPSQHFHTLVADHFCVFRIHNRRIRIPFEVRRDQFLLGVSENSLHRPVGCGLQRGVHAFLCRGLFYKDR